MKNKRLIIIGAGGHGRVVADIAQLNGYNNVSFLDDAYNIATSDKAVIGKVCEYEKYRDTHEFFVAIGNAEVRSRIQKELNDGGCELATLIHPAAVIGSNVSIGKGCVVMAGAVINTGVTVGDGAIINTASSVDHDSEVGEYSHVAVGAHICGTVKIGKSVWIGAGSTVINNVSICDNVMLGAGAVVIRDIDICGTYVGVPAEKLKHNSQAHEDDVFQG